MTIKNGDLPAMPIEFNGFGLYAPEAHSGLTKREYFAALAMQGLLSNMKWTYEVCPKGIPIAEWIARQSEIAADALLVELENSK